MNSSVSHARSPHYTALRCLFVVCLHRGVQLKPENFAEVRDSDTLGSILRVMQKVGLRGRVLPRCNWKKLAALGYAYPVMLPHIARLGLEPTCVGDPETLAERLEAELAAVRAQVVSPADLWLGRATLVT